MKTNFFATPFGSYVKALITVILMFFIEHSFSLNLSVAEWGTAIVIPTLPLLAKVFTGADGGFWNTAIGGLVKSVVTLSIAFITAKGTFVGWTITELLKAIIPSVLPVIFNLLNPSDLRYGRKAA